MAYETISPVVPANVGPETIADAQWGIDNVLSGWIIQSENITNELVTDTTQDQKGRVIGQLDYDKHYTCQIDMIGNGTVPIPGAVDLSYAGATWKVQSVTYQGSYNDKKKYSVSLERWAHFPLSAQG